MGVIKASILGADEFGFGSIALVALGCVMMRQCQTNTCPVGIATQDPKLRSYFPGEPDHLVKFFEFLAAGVQSLLKRLNVSTLSELRSQTFRLQSDQLEVVLAADSNTSITHFKPRTYPAPSDRRYWQDAFTSLNSRQEYILQIKLKNTDRAFGAGLGGFLTKRFGALPTQVKIHAEGNAGPSFMAFTPRGMAANLTGSSEDYFGKGLSGAELTLRPKTGYERPNAVICGNVALYGATSGAAYIAGVAGERFAIRNSGAKVVVEGVGDNACEYMTGGSVIVLGEIGENFAAGMSGGVAFVLSAHRPSARRFNHEFIEVTPASPRELEFIRSELQQHLMRTASPKAAAYLNSFNHFSKEILRILPPGYKNEWYKHLEKSLGSNAKSAAYGHKGKLRLTSRRVEEVTHGNFQ
jgi:glutamate synthase domain-containing protein 3